VKTARADLKRRRERVRRVNAKQPTPSVRPVFRPRPGTLDQLADLVLELLDERNRSGAR
jgi:hypothetical protein